MNFIADFHASGKVIGSICHAGQLLISAKLVKGRNISGYYSIKDDRIVSCPHYKHLGPWMKEVIDQVKKTLGTTR